MKRRSPIIHGGELKTYMREQVQDALTSQDISTSEMTEFYLVNLLCDFNTQAAMFEAGKGPDGDKPFAILLLEAFAGELSARSTRLKALGDKALIVSGFFADNIRRQLVDLSYYISIGGQAYGSLADIYDNQKIFVDLYSELSDKFEYLTEVIAVVAPWNRPASNADLVNIYKRWLESGDEKLESLLNEQGISTSTDELNKRQ